MKRRELIRAAGALGLAAGLPTARADADARATDAVRAFSRSFEDVRAAYGPTEAAFTRPLPDALAGTLYRNGPAGMRHGAMRYAHWFDGDGMVHAYRIADGRLRHVARMVDTPRRRAESAAGRLLWPGFATDVGDARPVGSPDTVNVGNISVLPLEDELLALWEAGSPWRLDPGSLQTRGRKTFSPETDGLSFSAHPRIEPDGRIWNFGYASGSGRLALYELDRRGALVRAATIEAPQAEMVHDFVITERYLGFVLMPLAYSRSVPPGTAFMNRLSWQDDRPVIVILVDKDTWRIAHRFELPAFFAFHFGNAWQDGDTVRITAAQSPAFDTLMSAITRATAGLAFDPLPALPLVEIALDTVRGRARVEPLPVLGGEFPVTDPRHAGRPTRRTFVLVRGPGMPDGLFGFNAVAACDHRTGETQSFDYGSDWIAEEHLFVPRPGAPEGEGFLVGTAHDWRRGRTRLSVFEAGRLGDGPITHAELPYGLPIGLHGRWQALARA